MMVDEATLAAMKEESQAAAVAAAADSAVEAQPAGIDMAPTGEPVDMASMMDTSAAETSAMETSADNQMAYEADPSQEPFSAEETGQVSDIA